MTRRKTDLEKYLKGVLRDRPKSCKRMKQLAERLLDDIEHPKGRWRFDPVLANRPCEFVERFVKVPSGRIGEPLRLEPYEKAVLQALFGFVDSDGMRRFNECFVLWARKNGKSTLAAAIELYMLVADGEGAPQIYNLATSGKQAELCFKAAKKMVRQSPDLSRHVKALTDSIEFPANMGAIKPMSANPNTLDGLDVHLSVLDEIHAMRTNELYALMKQATSAREQPLTFMITTNGFIRDSIFDAQYRHACDWLDGKVEDDRYLAFVYEIDEMAEWRDPACWVKANPGLGTVKKREYLEEQVAKAENDPSYLPTVLTKDFNRPQNSASAWLTFEEAVNERRFDWREMGFRYCIVGFDAADTIDLTCAQALMMRPDDPHIYERSMYWIPEDALAESENRGEERDRAPYHLWIARGLMRTVPGNTVPKGVLLEWLQELAEDGILTFGLGYDPWHMDDSHVRDLEAYVGKPRCQRVRQGAITLSQPMKQLRADYRAKRIVDDHNPVNEWCRMNVSIKADVNGNIQPYKKELNPANRIDGFMAEVDAYVMMQRLEADYLSMI